MFIDILNCFNADRLKWIHLVGALQELPFPEAFWLEQKSWLDHIASLFREPLDPLLCVKHKTATCVEIRVQIMLLHTKDIL